MTNKLTTEIENFVRMRRYEKISIRELVEKVKVTPMPPDSVYLIVILNISALGEPNRMALQERKKWKDFL